MKRILVLALLAVCCLGVGAAFAQPATPAVATHSLARATSLAPALDPYLNAGLESRVPMAHFCRDSGQCQSLANGTPCDTPVGCICGFSGGQRVCGRF